MAEPSKSTGEYNSAMGNVKQAIGGAIETASQALGGSDAPSSWTTAGKNQHDQGEKEIKQAEAQNYAEGLGDRVGGKTDSVVGAVTGDKSKQAEGNAKHDKGKLEMNANS